MKLIVICTVFSVFVFTAKVSAQDFEWGFESWELIGGIENPIGWEINNQPSQLDTLINRFYKDSLEVVEGNYSLRAEKDSLITSAFSNCSSMASLYQELEMPLASNQSVYFNVKTKALTDFPETYIQVIVGFSEGNDFLGRVEWLNYEEIVDWEEIEIPIPFSGGTAMSILINAASQNGAADGCQLESIVWLDYLRITESSTNSMKSMDKTIALSYPNPANGILFFKTDDFEGAHYTIFDIVGREIGNGTVFVNEIALDQHGLNFIKLTRDYKDPVVLKVINLAGN